MARLTGDIEQILARKNNGADDVIQVNMDSGSNW